MREDTAALSKSAKVVRHRILDWINRQELATGQRLPTERDLVAQLRTNRHAVREAIARLCAEGIIEAASPRIRVVAARPDDAPAIVGILSNIDLPDHSGAVPRSKIGPQRLLGMICALQEDGRQPLILRPTEKTAQIKRLLRSAGAGALVIQDDVFDGQSKAMAMQLVKESDVPVCSVADKLTPEEVANLPGIVLAADHARGCAMLVRHLANRGCRRILRVFPGDISGKKHFWLEERNKGYETECLACGLEPQRPLFLPNLLEKDTYESFDAHARLYAGFLIEHLTRDELPVGLLVLNDGIFHYAAAACRRLGYEPGREVLIAGYDNYWSEFSERRIWEPSVPEATIALGYRRTGEAAIAALERIRAGRAYQSFEQELMMIEPELLLPARPQIPG